MTWTEIEKKRYNKVYEESKNYGVSDFDNYIDLFPELTDQDNRVLDLGCGKAHLSKQFDHYVGVDISENVIAHNKKRKDGQYMVGSLFDLRMFNRWRFDIVFCNDVMEHIPTELVGLVLSEISRVPAKHYYFKIHKGKSVSGDETGNLHRTIAGNEWWTRIMSEFFVIEQNFTKGKGLESGYLSYFKCTSKENWIVPEKILTKF